MSGALRPNLGLRFERDERWLKWRWSTENPSRCELGERTTQLPKKFAGEAGDRSELKKAITRRRALLESNGGLAFTARLTGLSPFVTGMGQPHPIENGFAWHRTLGTPYLPGSGVKGLVLAYARDWWNWPAHRNRDADIRRIFGAGPENPQGDDDKQRGSVIFLDALPIEPVQLAPEVMTPHGPGSGEPQETANPTPIGFLTVKQATFDFGLLPARSYMNFTPLNTSCEPAEQAVEDCGLVSDWLQTALSLLGAGAKTRSGFGRMVADTQPAHGTVIARPD